MEQLPYSTLVPGEVAHRRWTFDVSPGYINALSLKRFRSSPDRSTDFLSRLHFSAEEQLLYPGVGVSARVSVSDRVYVHMQNVRAHVKILEFYVHRGALLLVPQ